MTGTERAALRLALGVLRRFLHLSPLRRPERAAENDLDAAAMILAIDEDPPTGAGDMPAIVALGNALIATEAMEAVPARLLRARLALYLRAVLRAEAGDAGDMERAEPDEAGEWRTIERSAAEWLIVCDGCRARLGPWCGFVAGDTTTNPCPITGKPECVRLAVPLWSQAPGRTP